MNVTAEEFVELMRDTDIGQQVESRIAKRKREAREANVAQLDAAQAEIEAATAEREAWRPEAAAEGKRLMAEREAIDKKLEDIKVKGRSLVREIELANRKRSTASEALDASRDPRITAFLHELNNVLPIEVDWTIIAACRDEAITLGRTLAAGEDVDTAIDKIRVHLNTPLPEAAPVPQRPGWRDRPADVDATPDQPAPEPRRLSRAAQGEK